MSNKFNKKPSKIFTTIKKRWHHTDTNELKISISNNGQYHQLFNGSLVSILLGLSK